MLSARGRRSRPASRLLLLGVLFLAIATVATPSAWAISWNVPATNLSQPGQDAATPQVAIAPDGATTITWRRYDGSNYIVQAATRPAGSDTFGAPEDISPAGQTAEEPQVAVAADGATTIAWYRYGGSIQARTRPAGSDTFGPVLDISPGQSAINCRLVVAPDGTTTIIWMLGSGYLTIWGATRPAGADDFSAPELLSQSGENAYWPRLAVAADGTTTATWNRVIGRNVVEARTRPAGSSVFGSVQEVSDDRSVSSTAEEIAVAPDGATTITWKHGAVLQASTRPAGSSTFGPVGNITTDGDNADWPQVAVAPDGTTTIAWRGNDYYTAHARTRPAGSGTFGDTVDISPAGQESSIPKVAAAPDGATTIVWTGDNVVRARTRPAGTDTFGPIQNLSEAGQDAESAQVAYGPDGTAATTWRRRNGLTPSNWIIQTASGGNRINTQLAGDGTGIVTSSPAGISCGDTCSAIFTLSTLVTLTATPAAGSSFSGWGGDCSGTSATCTLAVAGDRSATATFTKVPPGPGPGPGPNPTPGPGPEPTPTPSNVFKPGASKVRGSSFSTGIRVPGPGTITQRGTYRSAGASSSATRTACTTTRTATKAGTYTLTCRLNATARKQRRKGALRVTVRTTYTPTSGASRSRVRTVRFSSLKPKPKPHYTG